MTPHLLIADDEASVLAILRIYFERQDYRVSCARDGEEAIAIAKSDAPHLMILDIQMPRKTGVQVVTELRADARMANIPIIALTAHSREFAPAGLLQAGFDMIATKPFELLELQDIVQRQLALRAGRA